MFTKFYENFTDNMKIIKKANINFDFNLVSGNHK